jgi:hypothetical protein
MGFFALLIVAGGSSFAVGWLIHYIPLYSMVFDREYSPRLIFCKCLTSFDAAITLFLIFGGWIGLSTAVMGISMMIYNCLVGIGISAGVLIVRKYFIPRWTAQYEAMVKQQLNQEKENYTYRHKEAA